MMSSVFPNRSYMSWRILRSAFNFAIVLRFEKFSEPFDLSTSTWRVATMHTGQTLRQMSLQPGVFQTRRSSCQAGRRDLSLSPKPTEGVLVQSDKTFHVRCGDSVTDTLAWLFMLLPRRRAARIKLGESIIHAFEEKGQAHTA
ncbi:hypothetical protein VTO73DRAFT_9012 [Trametes versicolor]